jgi:hypothetical protein
MVVSFSLVTVIEWPGIRGTAYKIIFPSFDSVSFLKLTGDVTIVFLPPFAYVGSGVNILVNLNISSLVENIDIHFPGMKIDSAIILVC